MSVITAIKETSFCMVDAKDDYFSTLHRVRPVYENGPLSKREVVSVLLQRFRFFYAHDKTTDIPEEIVISMVMTDFSRTKDKIKPKIIRPSWLCSSCFLTSPMNIAHCVECHAPRPCVANSVGTPTISTGCEDADDHGGISEDNLFNDQSSPPPMLNSNEFVGHPCNPLVDSMNGEGDIPKGLCANGKSLTHGQSSSKKRLREPPGFYQSSKSHDE